MSIRFAVAAAVFGTLLVSVSASASAPDESSRELRRDVAAAPSGTGMPDAQGAPPAPGAPGAQDAPRAPSTPGKGTSVLRGTVTAADTGNPVRRAVVRAMAQDTRSSGMATTDADGRFEIKNLPGGRYSVTVSKAGYVMASYGQRRPEQPGTLLEILDGTTVDKLSFSLLRGGVITGTVLDEFGDPLAGAQVSALRYRYGAAGRQLMPSGMGAGTDDRGVFRIYGLTPGDYYVSAVLRSPQQVMFAPGSSAPSDGYAATYFPGTPNPAEATRVTVRAAQETANISMALIAARLARVSGRAVNSRGAPIIQGTIMARPADRMSLPLVTPSMTGVDGSFQLSGLPPGTYNLTLRPRGVPGPDAEFATMRLTVASSDIDGLVLMTAPGAVARGVITTDEGTPPPVLPEQMSLFARTLSPEPVPMFGNSTVHADWTFEMTGLSDARIITGSVAQNPDWAIKAVFHNSQDVTDTPIEFVPGHTLDGFNIVLTRKLTDLSGQITGGRNAPDTDATVIVFADNPDRWTFASRYIRSARPNQDGRYTLRGLPPHDYLVVAVKDVEPGQIQDPEFLESLRPQAVRVSLSEGESKVQDVKTRQ